jgi:hypothetical protein
LRSSGPARNNWTREGTVKQIERVINNIKIIVPGAKTINKSVDLPFYEVISRKTNISFGDLGF